jgi:hypothetical protein
MASSGISGPQLAVEKYILKNVVVNWTLTTFCLEISSSFY